MEKRLIKELAGEFVKDSGVIAAYLFGSATNKFFGSHSDIDLAILLREPSEYRKPLALSARASLVLRSDRIDILILNRAPVFLRFRVLQEGTLLMCQDEMMLADFVESTLRDHFDFKHHLDIFYKEYQYSLRETYGTR